MTDQQIYPAVYKSELADLWISLYTTIFSQDIVRTIHTETQMVDRQTGESVHKDLDCFVLVVTSHGNEGSIIGTDGKHVKITDITDLLSPKNFPEMKGKPKIVILQACAGSESLTHGICCS